MNTILLTATDDDISYAAELLKSGKLVAFPTETVYGLGANAMDKKAVEKIFTAKGRPIDNPFIVHIASLDILPNLVQTVPETARRLIDLFWPGPLTIVLKKNPQIPDAATAGLDSVGIRMPKNDVALRLLKGCGIPIAAPSANASGRPSPTLASHVMDDLSGKIDAVLDGGACDVGLESTVIDLTGDVPVLLRPGGITAEQLCEAIGDVRHRFEFIPGTVPRSPGVKYKHYAPNSPVIIVKGQFQRYVEQHAERYKKPGVITYETVQFPKNCIVKNLGQSPSEHAANLFSHIRYLDNEKVDIIFAQDIEGEGLGVALRNRLYKAADNHIVQG
ncbi:MAG: L-threonylcarbamoyladenylate synthase [Firmicutes bacterium]|nr:L-threonylcarbamoyladenylate synthase [Bacillota bacterium]